MGAHGAGGALCVHREDGVPQRPMLAVGLGDQSRMTQRSVRPLRARITGWAPRCAGNTPRLDGPKASL
jgi:hypothetical protein